MSWAARAPRIVRKPGGWYHSRAANPSGTVSISPASHSVGLLRADGLAHPPLAQPEGSCVQERVEAVTADGAITSVDGITVGHYTDLASATGCTVVLCEDGAVGGVDVRGAAPGTRETDLLRPDAAVQEAHAVLLTGGSAYGLAAASGVVRYLEEKGRGYRAGPYLVPIVSAAVLFDLAVAAHEVRPGPDEGYKACTAASASTVEEGSVGAGTGATVAKVGGIDRGVKGGIGTASIGLGEGVYAGAIVAVNAVGGVFHPDTGALIAGPRGESGGMIDPIQLLHGGGTAAVPGAVGTNTTIGVVATNARLTKVEANRMASVAHDGLAMAVRPAHTTRDGDAMFGLATGKLDAGVDVDVDRIYAAAALCVSRAIVRGVLKARGLGGFPAVEEL